jgi:hypothetical protein
VELKYRHPHWGAKKLQGHLMNKQGAVQWPALSTLARFFSGKG